MNAEDLKEIPISQLRTRVDYIESRLIELSDVASRIFEESDRLTEEYELIQAYFDMIGENSVLHQ